MYLKKEDYVFYIFQNNRNITYARDKPPVGMMISSEGKENNSIRRESSGALRPKQIQKGLSKSTQLWLNLGLQIFTHFRYVFQF